MRESIRGSMIKIYLDETDRWHGEPLYHAIVKTLREHGYSGATTIRGIEGIGRDHTIHTTRIMRLSDNLPVLIEILESRESCDRIFDLLEPMTANAIIAVVDTVTLYPVPDSPDNTE